MLDSNLRIEHPGYNIYSGEYKEASILTNAMPYRVLLESNDESLGTAGLDPVRPKEGEYVGDFEVDGKSTPCFITRVNARPELGKDEAGTDILFVGTVWVRPSPDCRP